VSREVEILRDIASGTAAELAATLENLARAAEPNHPLLALVAAEQRATVEAMRFRLEAYTGPGVKGRQ
jgi:hypothetical protein